MRCVNRHVDIDISADNYDTAHMHVHFNVEV